MNAIYVIVYEKLIPYIGLEKRNEFVTLDKNAAIEFCRNSPFKNYLDIQEWIDGKETFEYIHF
jgi:hypothetical protein